VFGLLTVVVPTPRQYYRIIAFAVFVGEAFKGLIGDTDY
jgi:hypothetical protein